MKPKWWEFVPEAVLGAGLTWFLLAETDAATSAFKSATAIGLMVAVGGAWIAARLLVLRFVDRRTLTTLVFGLATTVVLAVVVVPAFRNTTVIETLPVAAGAPTTTLTTATTAAPAPGEATTTTAAPPRPAVAPSAPTTTAAPAQPVAVREGPISGIDHRASGRAVLYRQPDGSWTVGLEDIDIQPGPDYDVYVVPGGGREDIDGGVLLDDLRGNKGTQYYAVPPEADLGSGAWTVLVWCQTFDVPVAGATPE